MHGAAFIQDLAVVMSIAGVVTILFHRLKQPVVLGYIVAGVIIGPHTPPFGLVADPHTINILGELGVVFLLFALGLEFSLRKLARVGPTAVLAAVTEIVVMVWIGWVIGTAFGWKPMDAIFLGAILAISSTTIIIKALDELGMKRERFAQLIFGILIVEDVLAIGMIALLSGVALTGEANAVQIVTTLGGLALFLTVALVVGLVVVPRLLDYVARFESDEMLLVTVLGLCFGFCLLVVRLDYSVALGAFTIGAIMAEARQLRTIERLIEPIRDMFSAIFFVTIGLLLDPRALLDYAGPIGIITVAVVLGKVVSCSFGAFVSGQDPATSLRVGMGLAQIGEFSFIIASLGLQLRVTSDFLYPVAVAVSAVTTFLTPYLIRLSDPLATRIGAALPESTRRVLQVYTTWLANLRPQGKRSSLSRLVRRSIANVLVNFALVAALFLAAGHLATRFDAEVAAWIPEERIRNAAVWGVALMVSLPFLVATYRKVGALSLLLAEVGVKPAVAGEYTERARRVVAEVIPLASLLLILLLLAALSSSILPPAELLILVLAFGAGAVALLWRWFVRLHARLQVALMDSLSENAPD
jgi:monovalent cation:H+ antiporter-2, CPA2 family